MRVKIGNQWYACEPGQPIMIELKPGDKRNIANMAPAANRYALFDDDDGMTDSEKISWMEEGAE